MKGITTQLNYKKIKASKLRTTLIFVTLLLTCIMITTVLNVALSMKDASELEYCRQSGSYGHAKLVKISENHYNGFSSDPLISRAGFSMSLGLFEEHEMAHRLVKVNYMDENAMKLSFIDLDKNAYALTGKEIIIDQMILESLGLNLKEKDTITLNLKINHEIITDTFIIKGIYEGHTIYPESYLMVSKDFLKEYLNTHNLDLSQVKGEALIYLKSGFKTLSQLETLASKYSWDLENIEINRAYMSTSELGFEGILMIVVVIALFIIGSYLLIYNIYLIAIRKEIKFFGLLKTIGMTDKQIKGMVIQQGTFIATIGIPLGLLFGYLLTLAVLPMITKGISISSVTIKPHLSVYLFATLFTYFTMYISSIKPAKIAGRVHPLEAIRSVDTDYTIKRKDQVKRNSLFNLAKYNAFRVKRKVVLVVLSLSISLILSFIIFGSTTNMSPEAFLKDKIDTDYNIGSENFYAYRYDFSRDGVPKDLIDSIESFDAFDSGIKRYVNYGYLHLNDHEYSAIKERLTKEDQQLYLKDLMDKKRVSGRFYGLENDDMMVLQNYLTEGSISKEMVDTNTYVYVSRLFFKSDGTMEVPYEVGEKITLDTPLGTKTYTIGGIVEELPYYLYERNFTSLTTMIYMNTTQLGECFRDTPVMLYAVNYKDSSAFNKDLTELLKRYPQYSFENRAILIQSLDDFTQMVKNVGLMISGILGLIGLLNFINLSVTNTIIRDSEFAILQSIGMTFKQIFVLLIYENSLLMALVLVISLLGIYPLSALAFTVMPIYKFTMTWSILFTTLGVFSVLILTLSAYACLNYKQRNLVNRLRFD
ncbi:MAG: ABC transporter permease [Clostridia bacterium]|nr:ABC transporter permease [Clostridia bacterium]